MRDNGAAAQHSCCCTVWQYREPAGSVVAGKDSPVGTYLRGLKEARVREQRGGLLSMQYEHCPLRRTTALVWGVLGVGSVLVFGVGAFLLDLVHAAYALIASSLPPVAVVGGQVVFTLMFMVLVALLIPMRLGRRQYETLQRVTQTTDGHWTHHAVTMLYVVFELESKALAAVVFACGVAIIIAGLV